MSKNYVLMQQAHKGFNVPPVEQAPHQLDAPMSSGIKKNASGVGDKVQLHSDKVTREESLKLVQNIFLLRDEASPRAVVFAGIESGSASTPICANGAITLASQKIGTVCLVDANLLGPSVPEYFGVSNHYGLTDALSKNGAIRDFTKVIGPDNLSLLSCGSLAGDSLSFLSSDAMKARIAELRRDFDYVLIDCPPLHASSESVTIAKMTDGIVLVLEATATRREAASRVVETLRTAQIKILGAVLSRGTNPNPGALHRRV
jgi:Mrp family chromosome partitioning ATPase